MGTEKNDCVVGCSRLHLALAFCALPRFYLKHLRGGGANEMPLGDLFCFSLGLQLFCHALTQAARAPLTLPWKLLIDSLAVISSLEDVKLSG
jgi:hypothetical protein